MMKYLKAADLNRNIPKRLKMYFFIIKTLLNVNEKGGN